MPRGSGSAWAPGFHFAPCKQPLSIPHSDKADSAEVKIPLWGSSAGPALQPPSPLWWGSESRSPESISGNIHTISERATLSLQQAGQSAVLRFEDPRVSSPTLRLEVALSPCSGPSPAALHLGQPRCHVTGRRDPSLQSPAGQCKSVSCDLSTVRSVSGRVPVCPDGGGACHHPCKWLGGLDEAELVGGR